MAGFIFGGDTGETAESLARKRAVAEALQARAIGLNPKNVGEGLNAIGAALAARGMNKRLDKKETEGRAKANEVFQALLGARGGGMGGQIASPAGNPPAAAPAASTGRDDDPAGKVFQALTAKGYPPHIAAGLTGNIQQESGFDTAAVGDNGNSFGMAQWNGPRKAALMEFAQQSGMDPASMDAQIAFLHHEMSGPESSARDAIMSAPDAETAARVASEKFWRPGVPMNDKRAAYASDAMARYGGGQSAPAQPQQSPMQPQQQGQPDLGALVAAMDNPYLSQGQRAVVGAMLQKAMAGNDPMASLNLEKARLEVDRLRNPQGTDDMREYEFARQNGYQGGFTDFMRDMRKAGASSVTVNNEASEVGTIPQGFELFTDETSGARRMREIPGGPAEAEAASLEQKRAAKEAHTGRYGDVVLTDIGRAREKIEKAPWYSPTTGLLGPILSGVGGTRANDVRALVDTVKANIGFDRLQQMRDNSPTGGALGQVSEFENRLLQATLGNLEQSQTEDQFLENLGRLENLYLDIVHGPGSRPDAAKSGGDSSVDDLLEKYR